MFSVLKQCLHSFLGRDSSGEYLRGQFIARHEGRVGWLRMLESEGVKNLAGDVFLNGASQCMLNGLSLNEINEYEYW